MNFGSLMYAAQSNASSKSDQVRCYKTAFAPPKKEAPKHRTLSVNVQKFLAKKEEEKRKKDIEDKKKLDELLALRSQDKMSVKRVSTMLKRTKSANKSVMEDAVDDVNTVVTMAGPAQCDEDDYGYVSQEASSFYNKLMDKYSNMPPEEDKFSKSKKVVIKDLNAAKERVKATLNRIEEEEMMPRKRKRKSKEDKPGEEGDDFIDDEIKYRDDKETKREEDELKPKKPKRPAPPPMDFSQLLKIAEQKQYEPVVIEKKPVEDEDDKPMTKKQRLEYLREKEARIQRERRELEDKLRKKPSSSTASSSSRRRSPSPSENSSSSRPSSQPKVNRSNEAPSLPRIPKLNHSSESSSKSARPSSESPAERLHGIKIPKLSDREKMQKSSSSLSSKPVPPSVAEEMLKKSGSVWSKPCNLSPSNSPNHKVNDRFSSNRDDRRNSSDSRSSSHQNLDRRKDTPEKQLIKKSASPSVRKSSSDELDRRKELTSSMNREKLREEIERKKLIMKQKLANDRNSGFARKDEKSNRDDVQQVKKTEITSAMRNENYKSSSVKNGDLQHKPRSNSDVQQKPRSNSDMQQKPRSNGDIQQKPRSNSDMQQKPRSNGDIQQKPRSNGDLQQKPPVKNKVLVDLFGDEFPNEDNKDKNKSSVVTNGSSKSPGKPNPLKNSSSSKERDDRISKSQSMSSKNIDPKSKSSISSSQNIIKRPIRPDDRNASSNKVQPRQFPPNDLKSNSRVNDKSRPGDIRPRQFPPSDVKPRQFPPPDMRPKQFPPPDVRRNTKPMQKRRIYDDYDDDDDEYDSEMDDFIDDGDDGADIDVSKHISEIFGYDKKRYKNIDDDDDDNMEANFAQVMKEEIRSTKIGIQEDYEEFLKDQAEKKRAKERKLQKLQKLAEMKKKRR